MTFRGMDPVVVRGLAQRLRQQAEVLGATMESVQRSVAEAMTQWDGDDAQGFNTWWESHYRQAITAAYVALVEMAATMERNVVEQEHVSGVGAGGRSSHSGMPDAVTPASLIEFAAAAYGGDHKLPAGWSEVTASELSAMGLRQEDFNLANGMDARLVTDGRGHFVLSYAGSISGTDWGQNGLSALSSAGVSTRSDQVESSVDLAMKVAAWVGTDHLTLTGHSLGGRDAAVASIATGATAVTFNAAGATDEDIMYAQVAGGGEVGLGEFALSKLTFGLSNQIGLDDSRIINFQTLDDPLSYIQGVSPVAGVARDPLGHSVVVPNFSTSLQNPFAGHDLINFEGKL